MMFTTTITMVVNFNDISILQKTHWIHQIFPYWLYVMPVDGVKVKMIKEWLGVDTTLNLKTHYWFCEEIKEANWENV